MIFCASGDAQQCRLGLPAVSAVHFVVAMMVILIVAMLWWLVARFNLVPQSAWMDCAGLSTLQEQSFTGEQ